MSVTFPPRLVKEQLDFRIISEIASNNLQYSLVPDREQPLTLGNDNVTVFVAGRYVQWTVAAQVCQQVGGVNQIDGLGCGYIAMGPNNYDLNGCLITLDNVHITFTSTSEGTDIFIIDGLMRDKQ